MVLFYSGLYSGLLAFLGVITLANARRDFSPPGPHEQALQHEYSRFKGPLQEPLFEQHAKKRCSQRESPHKGPYDWRQDPLKVCDRLSDIDQEKRAVDDGPVPKQQRRQLETPKKPFLNRSRPYRADPRQINKSLPG